MKHTFFTLFFMLLVAQTATILPSEKTGLVPVASQGQHPFGCGSREHRRPNNLTPIVTQFNNATIGKVERKAPGAATSQPDAVEALMRALAAQGAQQLTELTEGSVSDHDKQADTTTDAQEIVKQTSKTAEQQRYIQELNTQINALCAPKQLIERAVSPIFPHSKPEQQPAINALQAQLKKKQQECLELQSRLQQTEAQYNKLVAAQQHQQPKDVAAPQNADNNSQKRQPNKPA